MSGIQIESRISDMGIYYLDNDLNDGCMLPHVGFGYDLY